MNDALQELYKYLRLIYRRRYLYICVSLLVMTILVAWSYSLPKKYQASCTVFIESNVINSLIKGIAITPNMDERIRVLRYAMLSRGLLARVLEKMGHQVVSEGESKIEAFVTELLKRVEIKVRQNELFIVSIVDKDPHFARDFINLLVSTYVEESLSGTREETYGAKRFLDEQSENFREKLEQSENAIIEFRKKQGVYVTVNETAIISDLRQYQRDMEAIEITLATLTAQKNQYQSQLKQLPKTIPLFNEQVQGDRIVALETRVRKLLMTYTENYPEVVRLTAEIEALKRAKNNGQEDKSADPSTSDMTIVNPVYQEVQQKYFDLEAEISSLQSRKVQLAKFVAERERILQDIPENQKNLALLVQERDSNRRIYEELLLRHSQSEVSKQMEIGDKTTTFRIVDAAFLPRTPTSPNMMFQIIFSIVAGLGAGFGAVFILDNTQNKLTSVDQLQKYDVTILATIPTIHNPLQLQQIKFRDTIVYTATAIYCVGILSVLLLETYKRMF